MAPGKRGESSSLGMLDSVINSQMAAKLKTSIPVNETSVNELFNSNF